MPIRFNPCCNCGGSGEHCGFCCGFPAYGQMSLPHADTLDIEVCGMSLGGPNEHDDREWDYNCTCYMPSKGTLTFNSSGTSFTAGYWAGTVPVCSGATNVLMYCCNNPSRSWYMPIPSGNCWYELDFSGCVNGKFDNTSNIPGDILGDFNLRCSPFGMIDNTAFIGANFGAFPNYRCFDNADVNTFTSPLIHCGCNAPSSYSGMPHFAMWEPGLFWMVTERDGTMYVPDGCGSIQPKAKLYVTINWLDETFCFNKSRCAGLPNLGPVPIAYRGQFNLGPLNFTGPPSISSGWYGCPINILRNQDEIPPVGDLICSSPFALSTIQAMGVFFSGGSPFFFIHITYFTTFVNHQLEIYPLDNFNCSPFFGRVSVSGVINWCGQGLPKDVFDITITE